MNNPNPSISGNNPTILSTNPSISGKTPLIPATIDLESTQETIDDTRKSKRRKNCPSFSLLQLTQKIDCPLNNSSFSFSFPTDELTTTTPEVTPKFGSFNSGKESGHGSSESGHSGQAPVKNGGISEEIRRSTKVGETDKI